MSADVFSTKRDVPVYQMCKFDASTGIDCFYANLSTLINIFAYTCR